MEGQRKRDYAALAQNTKPPNDNSSAHLMAAPLGVPESGDVKKFKVEVQVEGEGVENETDRLTALPTDVTLNILQYLSPHHLNHCALVCRGLAALSEDNQLWKRIWEGLNSFTGEPQQGFCYKDLCKGFMISSKKWKTGVGVETFTKNMLTSPAFRSFRPNCTVSSRYIVAMPTTRPKKGHPPILVFSALNGKYSHELSGLPFPGGEVLLNKDQEMAVGYSGTVACVWRMEMGELLHSFHYPSTGHAMALHGALLAVAFDGGVFLWNIDSGVCVHHFLGVDAVSPHVPLILDDQHMAAQNDKSGILQLCDTKLGSVLFTWQQPIKFSGILLDSDTHSLVGLSVPVIKVWDTEIGTLRGTITKTGDQCYQGMVAKDGKLLVYSRQSRLFKHSILVIDLKGIPPSVLYSIDGPQVAERYHLNRMAECAVLTVVSSELMLVTCHDHQFIYLVDVKNRKFVRDIGVKWDRDKPREGYVVGINASFSRLQVIKTGRGGQLKYVSYDFSA